MILTALALVALTQPSFDCAKAHSPLEKIICTDPKLAAADRKMADAYRAALSRVSPDGRQALRDGQRQWLAMIDTYCTPQKADEARSCLETEYDERNTRLAKAIYRGGGLTIRAVDVYRLDKVADPSDTNGSHGGYLTTDFSYPQIDAPKSEAERRFNLYLQDQAKAVKGEEGSDLDLDFDDLAAAPQLISVELTSGFYAHGMPHAQYSSHAVHWLLPDGRPLKASDVFKLGMPWQALLRARCFADVKQYGFIKAEKDLAGMVEDPQDWSFGPTGLTVNFDSYEVASYADGQPEVLIPWSDLRAYLAPHAPVP
ncbi:MAG TPA: DUF3298 domain-containing protein [Rhizomicrobium sp.]|jgi:uncharacterized protein|nr:DUF3298 domain-containing protein [Rhizomicrobium sp.]